MIIFPGNLLHFLTENHMLNMSFDYHINGSVFNTRPSYWVKILNPYTYSYAINLERLNDLQVVRYILRCVIDMYLNIPVLIIYQNMSFAF